MTRRLPLWVLVLGSSLLVGFLLFPLGVLLFRGVGAGAGFGQSQVLSALTLSLWTTLVTLVITWALGAPLAFLLARSNSRKARLLETALQLPIVIPPSVAGLALLFAFGRQGPFGTWLGGISFTPVAVVMAQVFVAAPIFVQGAVAAFRQMDSRLLTVAQTFGASPSRIFLRVAIPLAKAGLGRASALCGARALGEFGATLLFAGNLQGKTQTMPLAIYTTLESDLQAALALSLLLLTLAFLTLLGLRLLSRESAL